jgi:hypothetical protein
MREHRASRAREEKKLPQCPIVSLLARVVEQREPAPVSPTGLPEISVRVVLTELIMGHEGIGALP